MQRIIMSKKGELDQEGGLIHDAMMKLGATMERAGKIATDDMIFYVYEKYFMRSSNFASLSVVIRQENQFVMVYAIASAGGSGIFNISWGANEDFLLSFQRSLERMGYQESDSLS